MRIAVIAGIDGSDRAEALARALAGEGADPFLVDLAAVAGETPLARMAGALRAAEAALEADSPDAAALTADDDHSLAAALVATKLQIPLYRLGADAEGAEIAAVARIDSLLADAVVPGDPVEAARAIADAVTANAAPSAPK